MTVLSAGPIGRRGRSALLGLSAVMLATAGCGGDGGARTAPPGQTVHVQAAASLTELLAAAERQFEQSHPGVDVTVSLASSGQCAKAIMAGAPCDVFISAGAQAMDRLSKAGLVEDGRRRLLLRNRLVVIVPKGREKSISGPSDLLGPGVSRVAICDPAHSPAGQYARDALVRLGLWEELNRKNRLAMDVHVKAVLEHVSKGFADAGVVYATDAARDTGTIAVACTFAEGTHAPIAYPAALLSGRAHRDAAVKFMDFLASDDFARLADEFGFSPAK